MTLSISILQWIISLSMFQLTVQAQDASPTTTVVDSFCSIPIHTHQSEAILNDTNNGHCDFINHPLPPYKSCNVYLEIVIPQEL